MDQQKIGRFIAERRKQENLTQAQLAEYLHITDRAVSKWETGKTMPDSSVMLALCDILKISVNDLLSGEQVMAKDYNKELEKNLLEMIKQKEENSKRLLKLELVIGIASTIQFLIITALAIFLPIAEWAQTLIILGSLIPYVAVLFCALKIEQEAGYYECGNCGHKYVPTFKAVMMAPHVGRTRYMRCPHCHEKTWQKKAIYK